MKNYSRIGLLALSVALVLLNASSLLGNGRLAQEADVARQQAAAWKNYALTVHGQELQAVELDAQATVSTRESPNRLRF